MSQGDAPPYYLPADPVRCKVCRQNTGNIVNVLLSDYLYPEQYSSECGHLKMTPGVLRKLHRESPDRVTRVVGLEWAP